MQAAEDADIAHQLGIVFVAAAVFGQEPLDQLQLFKLRQHLLHRREHRIEGVDQGAVPVKNQATWGGQFGVETFHLNLRLKHALATLSV